MVRDHRERQTGVAVEGRAGGEPSEGLCPRSPLDFHCWAGEDSRSSQAATKKRPASGSGSGRVACPAVSVWTREVEHIFGRSPVQI